jgi:HEAT repeat protein
MNEASLPSIRELTHALLRPETVLAAIEALRDRTERAAVEGLADLIDSQPAARAALAAIAALQQRPEPLALDALHSACFSPHSSVRLAAVLALRSRATGMMDDTLTRLLREDPSWPVRRAALWSLAERPESICWNVLLAVDDPHWRVRHALLQVLAGWGTDASVWDEIDRRLDAVCHDPRGQGVRAFLAYRWSGTADPAELARPMEDPASWCPFWDWDPAVLVRLLEQMGEEGQQQRLDLMPRLLGHDDSRVRSVALRTLRLWGKPEHLARALALLDEPRREASESVRGLRDQLNLDQAEATALVVFGGEGPGPALLAWAIDQVGVAVSPEAVQPILTGLLNRADSVAAEVRQALVRLLARWPERQAGKLLADPDPGVQIELLRTTPPEPALLQRLLQSSDVTVRVEAVRAALRLADGCTLLQDRLADPDYRVRICLAEELARQPGQAPEGWLAQLQADTHPGVRSAALTEQSARALLERPERETSWRVLTRASRLGRTPLWKLEPRPAWQPTRAQTVQSVPLQLKRPGPPHARVLGPEKWSVAPLGVSGHYGLPVEGFVRAVEAGVNVLFWEPNYQTLTEFAGRLGQADRRSLHFIAGTFEADGARIQRDLERALKQLKLERLSLFLLFWVQSWQRITPEVLATLDRLKQAGKVAVTSLSTHNRPLALEAMAQGLDPVMVRHSSAHRGAEKEIFPQAVQRGTSLISFNNICYGRLLRTPDGGRPPPVADFYRYCLEQPGVRLCLSAPATVEQLEENLEALRDPELPAQRRQALLEHGAWVYREDTVFYRLVRSR